MKESTMKVFLYQLWFIICSSIGGFLLSSMGLSIGWIVGSLLAASFLAFWKPLWLRISYIEKGVKPHWRQLGQCLIGIQLAKSVNVSTLTIFYESGFTVIVVLIASIIFSLGTGLLLYHFSKVDLLTGLFATSPGGVATMPSIAEEVGANTGIVSVVQMLRIFLVVTIVPLVLYFIGTNSNQEIVPAPNSQAISVGMQSVWTLLIAGGALLGVYVGKRIKLPAPWLVGSLIGVIIAQAGITTFLGEDLVFWWPHWAVILGQVLIGASVGSRFKKSMFSGLHRIIVVSTVGTIFLILAMFLCAYIVSVITGISFITSVLAFAPGGVVEMSTAAVSLQADSTFVVAVQTLRIVLVILLLPPFFKVVNNKTRKKEKQIEFNSNI